MKSHFFDIDTLISTNSQVWIVDKLYPNIPIIKISKSDFNLIKKGIYKNTGIKIKFSGTEYYLPENLVNKIKIKCKVNKTDITNLSFSMQEFMNKELIENIDVEIKLENILHLKNSTDDIYIICSQNTKKNYEKFITRLEEKLFENGLKIKKYYFITETFYNKDQDSIAHKKIRLILQHLLGLKTKGDLFTEQEPKEYDEISLYDDESITIEMAKNYDEILFFLVNNSDKEIVSRIKDKLKSVDKILQLNLVSTNKVNRFITTTIHVKLPNIFKTFESFSWSKVRN